MIIEIIFYFGIGVLVGILLSNFIRLCDKYETLIDFINNTNYRITALRMDIETLMKRLNCCQEDLCHKKEKF